MSDVFGRSFCSALVTNRAEGNSEPVIDLRSVLVRVSTRINYSTACHNLTFQDRKKASSYGRIRQVMAGSQPKMTKKRQVMAGSSSYARQVMASGTVVANRSFSRCFWALPKAMKRFMNSKLPNLFFE